VTNIFSESEIERMEDLRYTAMLNQDGETLNRVLHDKLLYVHSSGDKHTKTTYIAGLTDGVWDYQRIEHSNQTITLQGPLALVFNFLSISLNLRGKPVELRNRALAVWIHDNGSWQLIAVQSSADASSLK
jgi:Domain of unknown function (DUF4440)